MDLKNFLKKYSSIDNFFLDEFLGFYNIHTKNTEFVVNLENVAKWLNTNKNMLKTTLQNSYILNKHYILKEGKTHPHGGRVNIDIFITTRTFKKLCILTKTKKGEQVRDYFLDLEDLISEYKSYIINGLEEKIKKYETNLKKIPNIKKGFIYVFNVSKNKEDELYKVGRTNNLYKRMNTYNTGVADNIELLFVYEVEDIKSVETCIKIFLKKYKYRTSKEVYQINLGMIKNIILQCNKAQLISENKLSNQKISDNKELYVILDKN
jgi:phage anti-repressor protein